MPQLHMWGLVYNQHYRHLASHGARSPTPAAAFAAPDVKRRTENEQALRADSMQSLWPYQTYKPVVTWDKYYETDPETEQPAISSGVAAGVTIAVFLMVFLFTFGCRIYSQYIDRAGSGSTASSHTRTPRDPTTPESMMSESLAADLWICGVPSEPPPPYELALKMPVTNPKAQPTPV